MVKALEAQGGAAMPAYKHYGDECRGDVTVTFSISEHDKATVVCPQCGSTALRALVSTFFS
jgi:putative FmdB family regulatory protein